MQDFHVNIKPQYTHYFSIPEPFVFLVLKQKRFNNRETILFMILYWLKVRPLYHDNPCKEKRVNYLSCIEGYERHFIIQRSNCLSIVKSLSRVQSAKIMLVKPLKTEPQNFADP